MIRFFRYLLIFFILSGCNYKPIHVNNKYDFKFNNINSDGDNKANKIITDILLNNNKGNEVYDIYFKTIKKREIVTSDTKGDPKIYKLILNLKYEISKNGELVTQDKLEKQISYNSIKDKYELSQYEDNILKNLSTNLTNDILFALEILIK